MPIFAFKAISETACNFSKRPKERAMSDLPCAFRIIHEKFLIYTCRGSFSRKPNFAVYLLVNSFLKQNQPNQLNRRISSVILDWTGGGYAGKSGGLGKNWDSPIVMKA
jgi:hypothetical protein